MLALALAAHAFVGGPRVAPLLLAPSTNIPIPLAMRPSLKPPLKMSISLAPALAATGVWKVAASAGCLGALAQLGLYKAFQASPDPVLAAAPGYSAHQAIAFALMVAVSLYGLAGWLNPPAAAATAAGRLIVPSEPARWLGSMLLGMLCIWDIPASLLIPKLRKPDILLHHCAMATTALVGATCLPTHYGLYYMGVAELSSVPMTCYDQCDRAVEIAGKADSFPEGRRKRLRSLRDGAKAVAAIAFILVRAIDFTRVTLLNFVPDALTVLGTPAATGFRAALQFMVVSSVGFVVLQLYWFSLFVRISLAERKRQKRRAGR